MDTSTFVLMGGLLLAIGVGILTGIFGVGGGFLLTPALMIVLSVPGPIAVGTGLAMMLINSTFGMIKRRGTGTLAANIAVAISAGSLIGVIIGSWLLERLKYLPPLIINGRELVAVQFILFCAFLLMLVWVAGFMYHDYLKLGGQSEENHIGLLAHVKIPPYGHFSALSQPRMSLIALVLLGLITGFLTGLMGIGGGVVLLPALIYLVGLHTQKAAGTSLLLVWVSSLLAVIRNIGNNNIHWPLWGMLVIGGLVGTYLGTKVGLKVTGSKLRLYFVYVVLAAILLVGYKIVGMIFLGS